MTLPETELLRPVARGQSKQPDAPVDNSWWGRLQRSLSGYTPTAATVLALDAERITDDVAPRLNGGPRLGAWGPSRVRTGIVVGSVQSGKTANMLAVAAKALDRGVGLVVVLAGTRIALWLQTYERTLRQLDGSTPANAYRRDRTRVLVPAPNDVLGDGTRADARQYLIAHKRRIMVAARGATPVVIVVPKEDDHLAELARLLHEALRSVIAQRDRPLEMVVLDDEADDGSILTAEDPDKVTPSLIRHLWSDNREPGQSFHPSLLVTYVAYTATPQANYLQDSHNPLSPRDFHHALRVPGDLGAVERREPTFKEPEGLPNYYTGGRLFYERQSGSSCVILDPPERSPAATDADYAAVHDEFYWASLGDALRAFLVGAAVRLSLSGKRLSVLRGLSGNVDDVKRLSPAPHTMLVHPSARMEVHFDVAADILHWCSGGTRRAPNAGSEGGSEPDAAGLSRRLESEESLWSAWLDSYKISARALETLPGADESAISGLEWAAIRDLLNSEVFPAVALRVLNSDEDAADRPRFEPVPSSEDPRVCAPAPDLLSIFVAGNVLSRGLTLEGLTTSLFVRAGRMPAADTQMQMQRWFGYRGSYLSLCRVFLFRDQLRLFREYHSNDESLKTEILRRADAESKLDPREPFLVLRGADYRATAKVDSRKVPLHPGPTPAIKIVEHDSPELVKRNIDLVAELLEGGEWADLPAGAKARGKVLTQPIGLVEVAQLLERLRYSAHSPDASHPLYARWRSIETTWALPGLLNLPPGASGRLGTEPAGCPYSIAAYLRLWDRLLKRRDVKAFYPTDRPSTRWDLINLKDYQEKRPRFYLAIKYGEAGRAIDDRLAAAGVNAMVRGLTGTKLNVLWGSRGEEGTALPDQLFDYELHRERPVPRIHDGEVWRPRGHPGLLLLHVVRHDGKHIDMVAAGLGLPHGGPDHIAALR